MSSQKTPISHGDQVTVSIERTGDKGDGIANVNGFIVIVNGAKQGDRVKVEITKVLPKVAFAEIIGPADPLDDINYDNVEEADEF